jgi:hypothetical protein
MTRSSGPPSPPLAPERRSRHGSSRGSHASASRHRPPETGGRRALVALAPAAPAPTAIATRLTVPAGVPVAARPPNAATLAGVVHHRADHGFALWAVAAQAFAKHVFEILAPSLNHTSARTAGDCATIRAQLATMIARYRDHHECDFSPRPLRRALQAGHPPGRPRSWPAKHRAVTHRANVSGPNASGPPPPLCHRGYPRPPR